MAITRPARPAAQNKLMGKNVLVFLNYGDGATYASPVWALIGGQRNAGLSASADEIDLSDKTSGGWGETEQGIKSTEISLEGLLMTGDAAVKELKNAFIAGEAVDILRWAKDGTSDRNWYSITEFSDDAPHDDGVTLTVTLKGMGEPVFTDSMDDPREGTGGQ
jgi:TP901-1 family phage major tail protein